MKNLLFILFCTVSFTFFSSNEAKAQTIGNKTNCEMNFVVLYGNPSTCSIGNFYSFVASPHTSNNIPSFPGMDVMMVQASYTNGSCTAITVGEPCLGLPSQSSATCGAPCGNFALTLTGYGAATYHP